ncbi:MAG: hypothetical protein WBQ75_02045 [Acetobacteraceae bacterium]
MPERALFKARHHDLIAKYLELALAAGATLIVSSDNDLLILSPWRGIPILRPAEYLALTLGVTG